MSSRRAAVVVLAALVALAGCSKSDGAKGSPAKPGTHVGTAETLDKTTTTAPATTAAPTTTTLPPPVGLPDSDGVSKYLYDAWKAGDRVSAAKVATPAAIDGIWATAPGDYYLYNHCDTGEFDTGGCLYRGNSGTIQFDLTKQGANWIVTGAVFANP